MATKPKTGLGRGLGDLIRPTTPESIAESPAIDAGPLVPDAEHLVAAPKGASFTEISIDSVKPNPKQPRTVFDEEDLAELADSISEVGLLQPIVVRPVANHYELVMGERRLRASRHAGLVTIPAIIRATEEHDLLRDALLENLHRVQLNPLEEAAAYQQMLDDFGCTQEELAGRIKRSRPQISNTIRLLRLPSPVQRRVAAGVLSAGHARALLAVDDPVSQERLAQRIVAEGLSVRSVEELVTLGEQGNKPTRTRAPRVAHPRAEALAADLSDALDTRVTVQIGKSKGRITVEFAGDEDLDRVLTLFNTGISFST